MSKITKATFKSFIRKNKGNLLILTKRKFDGMTDGCEPTGQVDFEPITQTTEWQEHTCGIQGAWLVGGGRDYFSEYNDRGVTGINVYNSCGSFVIGVRAPA